METEKQKYQRPEILLINDKKNAEFVKIPKRTDGITLQGLSEVPVSGTKNKTAFKARGGSTQDQNSPLNQRTDVSKH